jgi:DNA-binding MarR family transcriptional regulator
MSDDRTDPVPLDPALDLMRLMWAVDHQLQSVSKRMLRQIGLTAPQRLAVRFIGREPGLTPGALAMLLHLHPGTVSGIVRRLEGAGLVTRRRSREDTRRIHLELTPAGQRLNRRRKGTVEAAVRRAIAALSPAHVSAAEVLMKQLAIELAAEHAGD